MTITETRTCPVCGVPFTWTSRQPRRRFCTPRCKAAWWRTSHYHQPEPPNTNEVANNPTGHIVRDVTTAVNDDTNAANTCPNCQQPIAVVTLLLPPAAAHVTRPRDTPTTRRPDP